MHAFDFQRFVVELESIFAEFQRLTHELDRDEEPQEARTQLGVLKRAVSERLPAMFRQIRPALVELEFWRQGILSTCDEIWLDQPLLIQGPATWLGYLGKVRQLLLDALGPDRPSVPTGRGRTENYQVQAGDSPQDAAVKPERRKPAPGTLQSEPQFLTPQQVAARYHVDPKTVRRKLRGHPEVRHVTTASKKGHTPSRAHLRIPVSLADRLWKPSGGER